MQGEVVLIFRNDGKRTGKRKKRMVVLLITIVLTFCANLNAFTWDIKPQSHVRIVKDLSFSKSDPELTLDLFLPEFSEKPLPCVLVIQGGGFKSQDGQRFRPFALYLAENGFAAALVSYRGLPDYTYKTTLSDIKEAAQYVGTIADKYKIDPRRTGVMGKSAGATLAVWLAVAGAEELSGSHEKSVRIKAAVAYAGVYDFVSRYTDSLQLTIQSEAPERMKSNSAWIGAPFSSRQAEWKRASAIYSVDEGDPPVLFLHCKDDVVVPWIQSQRMAEKMKSAGIPSELILYDSGGHGFKLDQETDNRKAMIRFFNQFL